VPVPAQATVMNIVKHCQAHFRIESLTWYQEIQFFNPVAF
jgi:hypothetical protein